MTMRSEWTNTKRPTRRSLIIALLVLICSGLAACAGGSEEVTELVIEEVVVGEGEPAEVGETVFVHYTGWLYDPAKEDRRGRKFDSSVDRGVPFNFALGRGRVIKGWDQGVAGMKFGGKRILTIPADLAYGAQGAGGAIPPNATLVFEIERLNPSTMGRK
jgi:FKBP-type peptidyl-prolyl cis-trans isomerase FkpA